MEFPEDQINELKKIAPDLSIAQEGGFTYILIKNLHMPTGCEPAVVDALLCPMPKDNYQSTLFFAAKITGCPQRNWNRENVRILGSNWFAISWRTQANMRLMEMVQVHLNAMRK
jgi:hypothetical protein